MKNLLMALIGLMAAVAFAQPPDSLNRPVPRTPPDSVSNIPFEVPPQPLPGHMPNPDFPSVPSAYGVSGKVMVKIYVDEKGEVKNWKIVSETPQGMGFALEVNKVVPRWKFTPAQQRGKPVGVWVAIPFNFKSDGSRQKPESQSSRESALPGIATAEDSIPPSDSFVPFEVAPQPLRDHMPDPRYPKLAMSSGAPGKVVTQIFIDENGNVRKWIIVNETPPGFGFAEEVEKVIPQWKFSPAIQQGKPVGVWIAIPINFESTSGNDAQPPGPRDRPRGSAGMRH